MTTPGHVTERQQTVARTKVLPSVEELPPIPEVRLSYEGDGFEIDVWVRGEFSYERLRDLAQRAMDAAMETAAEA